MKKILLFLITLFSFGISVHAASSCNYQEQTELNQKASNIKPSYEVVTRKQEFLDMTQDIEVFNITILNIPEELNLVVSNDFNDETLTFTSKDAQDGIVTFEWANMEQVTNFTIEAFTTDKTGCPGEKYKTIYLTTPRYNDFYNYLGCQDNPEASFCQKYVTTPEISVDEFAEKLQSYTTKKEEEEKKNNSNNDKNQPISDTIFDFINDYKFIIIAIVIVLIIGGIAINKFKNKDKKKPRDLGL